MATIKANHPARGQICDLPNYFNLKIDAIDAIDTILKEYGLELAPGFSTLNDCPGPEGRNTFKIRQVDTGHLSCDDCDCQIDHEDIMNVVSFSWYRMPSGRYEINVYIS